MEDLDRIFIVTFIDVSVGFRFISLWDGLRGVSFEYSFDGCSFVRRSIWICRCFSSSIRRVVRIFLVLVFRGTILCLFTICCF